MSENLGSLGRESRQLPVDLAVAIAIHRSREKLRKMKASNLGGVALRPNMLQTGSDRPPEPTAEIQTAF